MGGGSPTVLAAFNGTNGNGPCAGVTLSGGTLYGTTLLGGNLFGGGNGAGAVFSLPVGGGSPTVLASFNDSNGNNPYCGLTLSGSTLYGTCDINSTVAGAVFSVPASGGSPTVLASLTGIGGQNPYASLTLSGGTLYGTTAGYNNNGAVFSVPVNGGSPTLLASFNGSNGANPIGGLTLSGHTLYGTTRNGGAYGDGTVFSVPLSGGSPTVLASFNGSNGQYPLYGNLTLVGSTLYRATLEGGADGDGTVFALHLLPGDANNDGIVDVNDLTVVLSNYGQTGTSWSQGDFTGDGTVDFNDLTLLLQNFGTTAGAGIAAAPEPSTIACCCSPRPPASSPLLGDGNGENRTKEAEGKRSVAYAAAITSLTTSSCTFSSRKGFWPSCVRDPHRFLALAVAGPALVGAANGGRRHLANPGLYGILCPAKQLCRGRGQSHFC